MKVVVLVLADGGPEHTLDTNTCRETWASKDDSNTRIIFLQQGPKYRFDESKRTLYVPSSSNHPDILNKTILGFQWILRNLEFDFLIRSNCSTYFNLSRVHLLLRQSKSFSIGGYVISHRGRLSHEYGNEPFFISGAAIFLPRKSVASLSIINIGLNSSIPDDIVLTYWALKDGGPVKALSRSNPEISHLYFPWASHHRLKSSRNSSASSRRMRVLHQIHSEKSITKRIHLVFSLIRLELKLHKEDNRSKRDWYLEIYGLWRNYLERFRMITLTKIWSMGSSKNSVKKSR